MPVPAYVSRRTLIDAMSQLGFRPSAYTETVRFLRPDDGAVVSLSPLPDGDFNVALVIEQVDQSLALQDRLEPLGARLRAALERLHP